MVNILYDVIIVPIMKIIRFIKVVWMLPRMKSGQVNMCRLHSLFIEEVKEDRMLFAMSGTRRLLIVLIQWAKTWIAQTADVVMAVCWVSLSRHYGRNRTSLHGVKTQKTTTISTATAKAGEKNVLDSSKEYGLEVNTKNC